MKKHIYALWAFFILFSQSIAASVEVRSTHMTTGDGVANNSIRYIYQDSKGFIWMGTLNGLSRYDGNSFVTYRPEGGNKISLIDHRIRDLEEDKNGFLWIATSAELFSCYDLKKDCFVDFTGCGEYEQLYSYKMTDREGNVWLWQDGNGCRKVTYMNGEFTSVVFKKENNNLPSNNITYISEDEQGRIWIGSHDGIAQVVGNKAVLVEENHDAFKMMSFGKDVFFLSGTGTISLKREGEDSRLYQPSVEEVIQGCNTSETPVTYYSKEMRYPRKGGFKQFLSALVENQDIRYNQQVISIDVENRLLRTSKGDEYQFDRLISSLPLPEVIKMLKNVPVDVCNAVARLHCTCGYQISVGLKTKNIPPYLWWYIYDEDILPARVYSPSLKSPDNVPEGCSSLQMEVYCNRNEYTREELLARSVGKLVSLNILKQEDILFTDIRFEPYANVIFDHNIYEARKTVRDYLFSLGIETIGRFGKWGYLWSDQSLMSGLKVEM